MDQSSLINAPVLPFVMDLTRSRSTKLRRRQQEEGERRERSSSQWPTVAVTSCEVETTDDAKSYREVNMENAQPSPLETPQTFRGSTFASMLTYEDVLQGNYSVIETDSRFS